MTSPPVVVAVDVGGTEIKAALVRGLAEPTVLRELRRATPKRASGTETADAVVAEVTGIVAELSTELGSGERPDAVGVVVPGIVDDDRRIGVFSANLGWRDYPFGEALAARIPGPLAFGHDVRAGGLAEARLGAGQGFDDLVVLPIGTGIAGALIIGGRPHSGGGYAGEIGHLVIADGPECACGQRGCLELIASSSAVARRYTERTGRPVAGAADVAAFLRDGDPEAKLVWDDAVNALARAITHLATLFAPQAVVLGGGLAMAGELLTAPLEKRLDELITIQRLPELRRAALGDRAGCLGAALMAIEEGR
ncbi:ROK family protein [Allokutzneria sp. A3M-2-11 16]|uniref:ROK family protein n=1 Tax=Allokutzneria sp. A3M-2-11 16 TaxID=2962043 RepID=UPI0020B90090|nr:ROK family protein [Allokutzneria sp. A3M-2-11 16]MCP3799339.1 ROK family protein [Allokutzneria sp. A3M-2-11 16]